MLHWLPSFYDWPGMHDFLMLVRCDKEIEWHARGSYLTALFQLNELLRILLDQSSMKTLRSMMASVAINLI